MEENILSLISKEEVIEDSLALAGENKYELQELDGVLKSLEVDEFITLENKQKPQIELTELGHKCIESGTPEYKLGNSLKVGEAVNKAELQAKFIEKEGSTIPEFNYAVGAAIRQKWIKGDKQTLTRIAEEMKDSDVVVLKGFMIQTDPGKYDKKYLLNYTKRKLIQLKTLKYYEIRKGGKYERVREKPIAELTVDMLTNGSWRNIKFKEHNYESLGKKVTQGNLHPILKVKEQIKDIFIELGFEEMPTNRYVESSFWNFDALFQPQQHPARDAHDTFFIKDPGETKEIDEELVEKVKLAHEKGVLGSLGYRYNWKLCEAKKNILRTHTTAISARMLYKLGLQPIFKPRKYFSIDRVYRNETLDATHLAEFHQVEGFIADYKLCLKDLKGIISEFFGRLGLTNIKFKPTYNPYTEPSMELYAYHPGLNEWVEIGNSGIFRPEMLEPLNLPEDVRVIAWGLSVERPAMIHYKIQNIRKLFGHSVDIDFIKKTQIYAPNLDQVDQLNIHQLHIK